jgi:hypothetical protein
VKNPVMKLAEVDPLYVEVVLPSKLFGSIRRGQPAVVMPEAPVHGNYRSSVLVVDRVVDAASGTFGVRLEMANPQKLIPGGIRCQVEFSGLQPMAMKRDKDGMAPASFRKGDAR